MTTADRRRFSRVAFETGATLYLADGEHAVEVLDLSLSGALVRPLNKPYIGIGSTGTLKIRLDDGSTGIRMETTAVHHLAGYYGLACREIDLDSITTLRRLIALNLGDEQLADREFAQLTRG